MPLPPAAPLLRWWGHQRWIPFGIRDRVLRRLADPDCQAPTPFTCDFFGLRYSGDLASFIDWTIYHYGAYERAILTFLRDCAHPDAVFWDIGANVGQHSLFMARQVARVHAFEPWAEARQRLCRNVEANALANVTIHDFGLGESDTQLPFFAPASANWGTGSFLADVNLNQATGHLPVRRGDGLLAATGGERVDIVKIDTEGYEVKVLLGMREVLAGHRPVVVCELSTPTRAELGPDPAASLASLFGADWSLFDLGHHPETYRLRPFDKPHGTVTLAAVPPERVAGLRTAVR